MHMRRGLVVALSVVFLIACGTDDDTDDAGTAGDTVPPVSETSPSSGTTPRTTAPSEKPTSPSFSTKPLPSQPAPPPPPVSMLDSAPIDPTTPLVTDAVADLARRLDVSPDAVTVVEALAVTWPDGSLGCPAPGMMYTQVLVDGTFVLLEAGGQRYEYHGGNPLFLCEPGKGPVRDG